MAHNLQYLYNVEWQVIRCSMLGTWFNLRTAKKNYDVLKTYVADAKEDKVELKRRLWRVVNYLNAVRMGYSGSGKTGGDVDELLVSSRQAYQDAYHSLDIDMGEWDWEEVKRDLHDLDQTDRKAFLAILKNLEMRKDFSIKKIGTLKYRSELVIFVDMMREIEGV